MRPYVLALLASCTGTTEPLLPGLMDDAGAPADARADAGFEPMPDGGSDQVIFYGDFLIETEADEAELHPYIEVTGQLEIRIDQPEVELPNLRRVGSLRVEASLLRTLELPLDSAGELSLASNSELATIELRGLRQVMGVSVFNNPKLTSLEGLALERIEVALYVASNGGLRTLTGLDGLTALPESVTIEYEPALESLASLPTATSAGRIWIADVPQLGDLGILGSIEEAERISIDSGPAVELTSLRRVEDLSIINTPQRELRLDRLTFAGELSISDSPALTSIAIPLLTEVRGDLGIYSSPIAELALPSLHSVGGLLKLDRLTELTSLDGIQNLGPITGGIALHDLPRLASLLALAGVEEAGGVDLFDLPLVDSLSGLRGLRTASGFWLTQVGVADLTGLESLESLITLSLQENQSLLSLDLSVQIGDLVQLNLIDNPVLQSVEGLSGLRTIGQLQLFGNPALLDLQGLDALTAVEYLELRDTALQSLAGLEQVSRVRWMSISSNVALQGVAGLSGLTEAGTLQISGNPLLASLDGLTNVTAIDDLSIDDNAILAQLGLQSATSIRALRIVGNPLLPECLAEELRDRVTGLERTDIRDNLAGCTCPPGVAPECP